MDTTDKRYANFNAFKEDLLQWKNAHQEEYAQFARQMNDGVTFCAMFCTFGVIGDSDMLT